MCNVLRSMSCFMVTMCLSLTILSPSAFAETAHSAESNTPKIVTTASGLRYIDNVVGSGNEAKAGTKVSVHYTGWLDSSGQKGRKFDSSLDRNQAFSFPLGMGRVIQGWDEGVAGMKIGGKRTLLIPAKLGYGAMGAPPSIPPNADLIFDVELLSVG